jgi:hypothetical protein
MKKFCVLEQGKLVGDEMIHYHASLFNTEVSDFYRLNWNTMDDPDAFICAPGACWSEGRSLLYHHVPKKYEYYIFIDDDLTWEEDSDLAKNIADILDRWNPVAGCFPEFDAWHMTRRPGPFGEVSCVAGFDLNNHIFSASAADVLFPAVYHGSGRSFWHAQFLVYKLCPEKHLSLDSLPISNSRNLGAAQDTVEARSGLRPYFVMGPDMNIKYSEHMNDKTFLNWNHAAITAENFHASREFTPNKEELLFTPEILSRIYDVTNNDYLLRKPLHADIKYQVRGLR